MESHGVTIQALKPLPLQAIAAARLRLLHPQGLDVVLIEPAPITPAG